MLNLPCSQAFIKWVALGTLLYCISISGCSISCLWVAWQARLVSRIIYIRVWINCSVLPEFVMITAAGVKYVFISLQHSASHPQHHQHNLERYAVHLCQCSTKSIWFSFQTLIQMYTECVWKKKWAGKFSIIFIDNFIILLKRSRTICPCHFITETVDESSARIITTLSNALLWN